MSRVIQVIETYERIGDGTVKNPFRRIKQYFTFDGELLFEEVDMK